MKEFFTRFRWPIFLFLLVLAIRIPLLFRMDFADFPEFYRDYYMAQKVLSGDFPLYGPPSMHADFYFGPIYYYALAPLLALTFGHPASLILTGIVLYAFSAIAFYKLLNLWFKDETVSRFGSLFYAISIYGVQLNSYTSNPNFLPLCVILFFYFLTKILQGQNNLKTYFLLGCIYSIAAQLHITAAIILPLAALFTILFYFKSIVKDFTKNIKPVFSLLLGCLLPALPYVYAEAKSGFNGLASLFSLGQQTLHAKNYWFALEVLVNFFRGSLDPFFMSNSYSYIQPTFLYLVVMGVFLFVIFSFLVATKKGKLSVKKPKHLISRTGLLICFGWLLFETLLLMAFNKSPHSHYLIVLWPLPAIILTLVFAYTKEHLGIYKSLFLLIVIISALQIFTFYNKPATPWSKFYPVYEKNYKYFPQTEEIGSPAIGWPQPKIDSN